MIAPDELGAWLRLTHTPGLGRVAARRLLAAFGSPQAVVAASASALGAVVGAKAVAALTSADLQRPPQPLQGVLNWLAEAPPDVRHVATLGDPDYPQALLDLADPPLLLYLEGRRECLRRQAVAVVGSRHPSAQGVDNARALASHLGQAGWCVLSGLALGVDTAAHEGALETPAGTVAVVGTGLDRVYPARNARLAARIGRDGLLVSEYALGTPPLAEHFPQRNRLIAALGRGTLVVEAALRSGSLITARLANDLGREVFAVPGSIHSPQARGCHALIKQGAKLVETATDILEELAPGMAAPFQSAAPDEPSPVAADMASLWQALGHDPVSFDALSARTGLDPGELTRRLLDLELDGRIARLPGPLFQRRARPPSSPGL